MNRPTVIQTRGIVFAGVVAALASMQPAAAEQLSEADAMWTRNALKALDASNWKMARRFERRLKSPLARQVVEWSLLTVPSPGVEFRRVADFMRDHPEWPLQARLQRRAEEAMPADMPAAAVLAWFEERPPLSGYGLARLGAALLEDGDREKGRNVLRRAWIEGNFTKVRERAFYKRFRKLLTREDHLARLDRLLWAGRTWPVRRMLWKVNADYRALGLARISLRRSTGNVDTLISKVPDRLKNDPGLIYERLRWRRRKGKDTAFELLNDPPADLGRPALWWKERAVLARRALGKGNVTDAYRIAAEHRLVAGPEYADAEWLSGWVALRFLGDHETALKHFTRMFEAVRFPISLGRGAYWAARAAEAGGDKEAAEGWDRRAAGYRTTYYGQLSAARLSPGRSLQLPEEPEVVDDLKPEFGKHPLVRVVELLGEVGAYDRIKPFILHLASQRDERGWKSLAAGLARSHSRPDLSVTIAKRASRAGSEMLASGYPLLEPPAMHRRAPSARPEIPLILAVIRQESAFRLNAKSRANALGLMQLLPRTARKVARRLGLHYSRHKLTRNADYNLTLGQTYLGGLLSDFKGSYVLALASYNAGPARAKRWIRKNGDPRDPDVDAIDWVEMIPIGETRNYVQRVLENLQVYRMRLADTEVALSLESDLHQ